MSTVQSQFSFQRVTSAINAAIAAKQDTLVSGTNIKTVNSTSLLGSGDIAISVSTAPLVLGTNLVEQRNGTNGQIHRWYKTYTSATNGEWCEIDEAGNATTFDIAAAIGSAGGTARGIRIGGKSAAGVFTSWLSFETNGNITLSSGVVLNTFSSPGAGVFTINNDGNSRWVFNGGTLTVSGTIQPSGSRNLGTGSARFANVFATVSDCVDFVALPSTSRTLATNGQLTIERVSNTEINLVYRGDDGVTRRSLLTFV
jgi:hypothetical protein